MEPASLPLQSFECDPKDLVEEKELGRGAYGAVYRMRHEPTGTIMAVKVRPSWLSRLVGIQLAMYVCGEEGGCLLCSGSGPLWRRMNAGGF